MLYSARVASPLFAPIPEKIMNRPKYAQALVGYAWLSIAISSLQFVKPTLDSLKMMEVSSADVVGFALIMSYAVSAVPILGSGYIIHTFRSARTTPPSTQEMRGACIVAMIPCLTFWLLWPVGVGLGIWGLRGIAQRNDA